MLTDSSCLARSLLDAFKDTIRMSINVPLAKLALEKGMEIPAPPGLHYRIKADPKLPHADRHLRGNEMAGRLPRLSMTYHVAWHRHLVIEEMSFTLGNIKAWSTNGAFALKDSAGRYKITSRPGGSDVREVSALLNLGATVRLRPIKLVLEGGLGFRALSVTLDKTPIGIEDAVVQLRFSFSPNFSEMWLAIGFVDKPKITWDVDFRLFGIPFPDLLEDTLPQQIIANLIQRISTDHPLPLCIGGLSLFDKSIVENISDAGIDNDLGAWGMGFGVDTAREIACCGCCGRTR